MSLAASALLAAVGAAGAPPPSTDPDPRAHHQLVAHPGLDRVFLIGGSTPGEDGHRYFDDIWAWDGEAWSPAGRLPLPRSSHRAVYDPSRASVLLFGGTDGDSVRADGTLREWLGEGWRVLARSEEAARGEPGACFDRRRERLVLFGGVRADGSYAGSTWEWDGSGLRRVAGERPAGPGGRLGHALAWDPVRERCLLFGGRDADGTVHGDTRIWDGEAWRELRVEGPSPRWIFSMATDPVRGRIVLFGGQSLEGDLLGDTWAWDGEAWEPVTREGPSPRMMGRMAFDGTGILLFGGRAAGPPGGPRYEDRGDTWRLREARWRRVAPP